MGKAEENLFSDILSKTRKRRILPNPNNTLFENLSLTLFSVFLYMKGLNNDTIKRYAVIRKLLKYLGEKFFLPFERPLHDPDGEKARKIILVTVVQFYKQFGFATLYDLFYPFFCGCLSTSDYEHIVVSYARKCSKNLEVVVRTSKTNEYICRVSIGTQSVVGKDREKQRAIEKAMSDFGNTYLLEHSERLCEQRTFLVSQRGSFSSEQYRVICKIKKIFGIEDACISNHQIYNILFLGVKKQTHQRLFNVGKRITDMLSAEFYYLVRNLASLRISRDFLYRTIQDETNCLEFDAFFEEVYETKRSEQMLYVLYYLVGTIWLNNFCGISFIEEDELKKYIFCFFESLLDHEWSCEHFLINFYLRYSDEYNWDYGPNKASLMVWSGSELTWRSGEGKGENITESRFLAIRNLISRFFASNPYHPLFTEAQNHSLSPELVDIFTQGKQQEKQDSTLETEGKVSFDNTENILYVFKGTISCRSNSHHIVSATGIVPTLNGLAVFININYCQDCGIYFINADEFQHYQNYYDGILGNIRYQASDSLDNGYEDLAPESILHIYGYTVNQKENMSAERRRKILSNLMDHDIVPKYRIIEYLQFYLNMNGDRWDRDVAIRRWRSDLEWVRTYKIDKQRRYIINAVEKW